MSTSLAEQLQKLAVPQAKNVIRGGKTRVSLLFNPKEAAALSRESVFQIGLDGFEELKLKNPIFDPFENTLFHIVSKDFERSVQSAKANENLDKNIKRFIFLAQPYLLLNCTHKALEWLIFRYHIHQYNIDDLMMLILPYHDTNIFVKILQAVKIVENSRWAWLKPLQKPGIHLAKQTLYNHGESCPEFLKFISDNLLEAIQEYENPANLKTFFNFYCMTFVGSIEYAKEIKETHVSQILPLVLKGLKSDIRDFNASALMIVSKLLTKTQVSDKLLGKLTSRISACNNSLMGTDSMLALLILYQSQEQYTEMNVDTVLNLADRSWLVESLHEIIDKGYFMPPLLKPMLRGVLRDALEEVATDSRRKFADVLVKEFSWEDEIIKFILNSILELYDPETTYTDEIKAWTSNLVNNIEKQSPQVFDNEVSKIIKDSNKRIIFQTLAQNNDIVNRCELFEKLYHSSPDIRQIAVKTLHKLYPELVIREQEFIKSTLIDRLNDYDIKVVRETLDLFNDAIFNILSKDELKPILIKIIKQSYKLHNYKLAKLVFKNLDRFDENDYDIFIAILPFLLPLNEKTLVITNLIINSKYLKKSIFKNLEVPRKNEDFEKTFNKIFNAIKSWNVDTNKLISLENDGFDNIHKLLHAILLTYGLSNNSSVSTSLQILEIIINYYDNSEIRFLKNESNLISCDEFIPLQQIQMCIEELIRKTKFDDMNFSKITDSNTFLIKIVDFIQSGMIDNHTGHSSQSTALFTKLLKSFFEKMNISYDDKLKLLLNLSIIDSELVSELLRIRSLNLVAICLKNKQVSDIKNIIPYLLAGLNNPQEKIRLHVLEVFRGLKVTNNNNNYQKFIENILSQSQVVILDYNQLPLIVNNSLQSFHDIKKDLVSVLNDNQKPVYLKLGVVKCLQSVQDYNNVYRVIINYTKNILKSEVQPQNAKIIKLSIEMFDEYLLENLSTNSDLLEFLKLILSDHTTNLEGCALDNHVPSTLLIDQIDKNCLFNHFNTSVQKVIINTIINAVSLSSNPNVLTTASKFFKHIDLDATVISDILIKMRDMQSSKFNETKRKRRVSVIPTLDILETNEWKNGMTLLEFIQEKKKMRGVNELLPVLFDLLKKCLDFDEQASVEYPKQLILSSILHFCQKIEVNDIPKNVFNMELVVQCIRASQNPQTHHHALLLLACVAVFVPDQVLHHMMSIFTFMGSSVLRHDDAYSFQIIIRIIEKIIPILLHDNKTENILNVLRVFVDVILDVPEHRRMPLYVKLLEQIGTKNNLYLFLLLIFDSHVVHSNKQNMQRRLEIATCLSQEFSPNIVITTCINLIKYIKLLPEDKEAYDKMAHNDELKINSTHLTPKQYRHYKYTLVTFISSLLSSKEFVLQVAQLTQDQPLESLHANMIVETIAYIQKVTKVTERNANTPQMQYWKVMLHHTYDILDSVNALLTPQMFLKVMKGLLMSSLLKTDNTVKRRSLELLNSKLQHHTSFMLECDESELLELLHPLQNLIIDPDTSNDKEIIVQTALITVKLLVRLLATKHPEKFVQILHFVTNIITPDINPNILASTVICLAELCSTLKAHSIKSLNQFVPTIIKNLKSNKHETEPTLLLVSLITALNKLLDCLPLFLSSYLEKLLFQLCNLSQKFNINNPDPKVTAFAAKLTQTKTKIGENITPRVLIPIISSTYAKIITKEKYESIAPLMEVLSENFKNIHGSDLVKNMPELTTLFLSGLEFRSNYNGIEIDIHNIETPVILALTKLVLKLSESTFRPFYYKLYDWAAQNNAPKERAITFYALSTEIAKSLKSLFVLFAAHFIKNAANLLNLCNPNKSEKLYFEENNKNLEMSNNILKTLNAVFQYDSQRFVNKDRFEVLMLPIVDQLDNNLDSQIQKRAEEIVIPCIVNFAVATADDSLWKQLNYQVLLKMRDANPTIRLIALNCLRELAKKLGEDFLPLLPETIPFLSELLEDEEETVEKACQKTVQEMEKVLGEPLQKYF